MAWNDRIQTSIWGRRIGLQTLSTAQQGGRLPVDLAVGPDAYREAFSSAESTGTNIRAFGHSMLTTVASSAVFVLDPPIPGVNKKITFGTTGGTLYLKGANGEAFASSQGTSFTVLKSTQNAYTSVELQPISSAAWMVLGALSSGSLVAAATT